MTDHPDRMAADRGRRQATIRILIVDDHAIVRRGLVEILSAEADMKVTGEAHDADEMLTFVRMQECDVVVMDLSMPGRSALDALKELKGERPLLSVLVFSMHPEAQYAQHAMKFGASGYLTKDSPAEELVRAIRIVAIGARYISPTLTERLVMNLTMDARQPLRKR